MHRFVLVNDNNNYSNINIKKKSLIISLVVVSFISIILLTTSILSSFTFNSGISSVNAQQGREPQPKSPSQLQTEEEQQQPKSPSQLQAEEEQQQSKSPSQL